MLLQCALSKLSEDLFVKLQSLRSLNPRHHAQRDHAPRDPKNKLPQKPYDDPKFASHVLYLSANSLADGFVPFNANDTSSCVTRFAPINF